MRPLTDERLRERKRGQLLADAIGSLESVGVMQFSRTKCSGQDLDRGRLTEDFAKGHGTSSLTVERLALSYSLSAPAIAPDSTTPGQASTYCDGSPGFDTSTQRTALPPELRTSTWTNG